MAQPELEQRHGVAARLARGIGRVAGGLVTGAAAYTIWEGKRYFLREDIRTAIRDTKERG